MCGQCLPCTLQRMIWHLPLQCPGWFHSQSAELTCESCCWCPGECSALSVCTHVCTFCMSVLRCTGASSLATVAPTSQQPVPHISTATTSSATQSDVLSAAAEPVTPEALAVPAAPAPAAENPTAVTAGAGSSHTAGQAAGSSSSSSDAVAAAPRSWRELLAGPQAVQQQNGQQVQETVPAAAATVPTSPTAAPAAAEDNGRLLGWTEGCLPQVRASEQRLLPDELACAVAS